jgi:hypothetical protein
MVAKKYSEAELLLETLTTVLNQNTIPNQPPLPKPFLQSLYWFITKRKSIESAQKLENHLFQNVKTLHEKYEHSWVK